MLSESTVSGKRPMGAFKTLQRPNKPAW